MTGYPARRARLAVWLVLSASFVVLADVSIVNLAAPVIQADLHADVAQLELTVAGYQVAYGAMLVTGGRLGDIVGRRAMFIAAMSGFVVASAACGLAATPGQLVAFRVLQGTAAGLLSPQVLATIQIVLPPSKRAGAFAALGAVLGLATILGPLIAGLLVAADLFGTRWRPIFLVNVPIGVVAVAFATRLLPAERTGPDRRVDVAGTVLLTAVWVAVMTPLTVGPRYHWPLWTWASLATVPVLGLGFLRVQRRLAATGRDPLLPPELWRDRAFRAGVPLNLLAFSGVVCFFLYYSIVLQSGYRLSTVLAGASTIPSALGTVALSAVSPKLVRRFGAARVVSAGALVCAAGFASMLVPLALVRDRGLAVGTMPAQFVAGAGFGLVLAPMLSMVLAGIRGPQAGAASGLLTSAQVIGGGLGVVAMGLIFQTALPHGLAGAPAAQLRAGLTRGVVFDAVVFAAVALLVRAVPRPASPDGVPAAGRQVVEAST